MLAGMIVVLLAIGFASGEALAAQGEGLPVPGGDGGSASLQALPPGGVAPLARSSASRRVAPRRGGTVRAAWPHRGSARPPRLRLARWLARQTGPVTIARRRTRIGSTKTPATGEPRAVAAATSDKLLLVRSFDIPKSDASYAALTNFSWTYDNALAVFAFISNGDKSNATQLLDQLAALQRTDGSLDFAYDVASGAGAGQARAGSLAWVGLAAAAYKRRYNTARYDPLIGGILDYVLALRTSDGLVRGGTDVGWVSTQHNLLTVEMLRDLADQLGSSPSKKVGSWTGAQLNTIQGTMGNAILSKLLVQRGALASFRAGVGDDAIPIDVQALGAMYLDLRGDARDTQVANYVLQAGFFVGTRAAADGKGLVSGYRPYLDATSPDVIWSEGTLESQLAFKRLGVISLSTTLSVASLSLTSLSGTVGPIAADRTSESRWGEFHTWSASAPASWLLVLNSGSSLLYAQ